MPPATDPYRTLGLPRSATLAEVKRAYRRLAKEHHPDTGGPAALPRFLAIQAAYEQLVDSKGGPTARASAATRASAADPARADATHRAYAGRSRRARSSASGAAGASGATGSAGSTGTSGPTSGGGPRDGAKRRTAPGAGEGTAGPSGRARGKATLGSTSYDGADAGPFEPDWGGASWYGTTSGTYWTINPKEYADPRKHGPEYQARARRAARAAAGAATGQEAAPAASIAADDATPGAGEPARPAPDPVHTTTSWWAHPAPDPDDRGDARAAAAANPRAPGAPRPAPAEPAPPVPDLGAAVGDLGRALTDERSARGRWRVAQAVVGWLPIAFGLGWLIGEWTGCGRSAASCDGADGLFAPIASVLTLGLLLLLPRLAALAAAGAIGLAIAAVPAAAILSASDGSAEPPDRGAALGVVLLTAWIVGLAVGIARRVRAGPPSATSPVDGSRPVS